MNDLFIVTQEYRPIANSAIIVLIAIFIYIFFSQSLKRAEEKKIIPENLSFLIRSIFKWSLILFAGLFILQEFKVTPSSIWTVISTIAVMLAIGFVAVWSVLSNILCSLLIFVFEPFEKGDEVHMFDPSTPDQVCSGIVLKTNILYTILKTLENEGNLLLKIPNNLFFQKIIKVKPKNQVKKLGLQ